MPLSISFLWELISLRSTVELKYRRYRPQSSLIKCQYNVFAFLFKYGEPGFACNGPIKSTPLNEQWLANRFVVYSLKRAFSTGKCLFYNPKSFNLVRRSREIRKWKIYLTIQVWNRPRKDMKKKNKSSFFQYYFQQ